MKTRFRSFAVTMTALFVMGGILTPQIARADIEIDVYISGTLVGTQTVAGDSNTYSIGTITSGGTTFNNITIIANDNQPGDSTGNLTQESITAHGSSGSGTLQVVVQEKLAFTSPGSAGSPMLITSNVSRSDGKTATTLTFQSWANGTVTSSSPFVTGGSTPGQQTFDSNKGTTAYPNQATTSFVNSGTYTLQSVLTLKAGDSGNINVNGSTTVSTPEPSTMAIAGLGALGMIGYGLRRRKAMGA